MGYQPLARDGTRLHSGRAQTILGWGDVRRLTPAHVALEPSVKPGVDAPQNHGGVPGWQRVRRWARVGDSSALGLERGAVACGSRGVQERGSQTGTHTDSQGWCESSAHMVETSGLRVFSVMGRVVVNTDHCAEVQALALPHILLLCPRGVRTALLTTCSVLKARPRDVRINPGIPGCFSHMNSIPTVHQSGKPAWEARLWAGALGGRIGGVSDPGGTSLAAGTVCWVWGGWGREEHQGSSSRG